MSVSPTLKDGRDAFRLRRWTEAYALLSELDVGREPASLSPADVEVLARAAYLTGKNEHCTDVWARAHQGYLDAGDIRRASRCAFWLGLILFEYGDRAQGGGWMARAIRLADDFADDCVEKGYVLIPQALQQLGEDPATSHALFGRAAAIGSQFEDADLKTLGLLGQGQALINQNKIGDGTTLLDEAMVAVVSDQTSPMVSGIVYCAVIETCQKIYDMRRAQEWTTALSRWCRSQPDLVPYRGQCVVRRAQIMQLHGEWSDAMTEAQRASDLLSDPGRPAAGEAFYRQAELHRLRGEYSKAEEAYGEASKWGRDPQPGLALLRLGQGQVEPAVAAIRRCRDEAPDSIARAAVLPAYVEIMLTAGDRAAAKMGADELSEITEAFFAPYLTALAAHAAGHVLLDHGDAHAALEKLIRAWSLLKGVEALYESARTRVLIGQTYRALGDEDTAEMELEAARWMFHELGAAPDFARVVSLIGGGAADGSGGGTDGSADNYGLTPREIEVLTHVTTGKTNRDIADDLYISERTVDRHVSNILSKLNVSSRAAATAFAYENDLV